MTLTGTQPHKIYLAGKWVDSPDPLEVANPADPANPAGTTYNATEEQYEEAVTAAVAAFEQTRVLPAYERGRALREISNGIKSRREELGRVLSLEAGKPIRDALVEVDRAVLTFRPEMPVSRHLPLPSRVAPKVEWRKNRRLVVSAQWEAPRRRIEGVASLLLQLKRAASQVAETVSKPAS